MSRLQKEGADAWNGAGYAIDEYEDSDSDESTVAEESQSEPDPHARFVTGSRVGAGAEGKDDSEKKPKGVRGGTRKRKLRENRRDYSRTRVGVPSDSPSKEDFEAERGAQRPFKERSGA